MLLVSHRSQRVTVVERTGTGWVTREVRAGEQVVLQEPKVTLDVDSLYGGVTLDAE